MEKGFLFCFFVFEDVRVCAALRLQFFFVCVEKEVLIIWVSAWMGARGRV
jgi:hypothetical protein